ncbi:invasion associated locus B family protein [Arsenicitalea aurantiaca]|nr:invasion associated locus B family protein [Arsenicitalea aurantiaca]
MRIVMGLGAVLAVVGIGVGAAVYTGVLPLPEQAGGVQPAQAQSAGTPPVPAARPETSPAPAAQAGTPAGAMATAAPNPNQPRVLSEETFGDWVKVCLGVSETEQRCSISQQLADSQSRAAVFVWRISQDGAGGLVGIWQTPEGVLLSRGITLDAGTPQPIAIPYETCGNGACQAVANLAPDFVETLRTTAKAEATIVLGDRRAITLPLSTTGLSDGLASLGVIPASAPAP